MQHLESRLFMAGMATPSPTPMHARANRSAGRPSEAARGVRAVAMLHQMTPKPSTALPPYLSAHTPPATCVVRYPLKDSCECWKCSATEARSRQEAPERPKLGRS